MKGESFCVSLAKNMKVVGNHHGKILVLDRENFRINSLY